MGLILEPWQDIGTRTKYVYLQEIDKHNVDDFNKPTNHPCACLNISTKELREGSSWELLGIVRCDPKLHFLYEKVWLKVWLFLRNIYRHRSCNSGSIVRTGNRFSILKWHAAAQPPLCQTIDFLGAGPNVQRLGPSACDKLLAVAGWNLHSPN